MRINADAETDMRDQILPHLSRFVKAAVTRVSPAATPAWGDPMQAFGIGSSQ
jgi:hypothetical protein